MVDQWQDEQFIEQIRERLQHPYKEFLSASGMFLLSGVLAVINASVGVWQWRSISPEMSDVAKPIWIGIGLGALVGAAWGLAFCTLVNATIRLFHAIRGGSQVDRLLLEMHDELLELRRSHLQPGGRCRAEPYRGRGA